MNAALPCHSVNIDLHKYLSTCYSEKKDSDKALYHQNLASDHNTSYRNNINPSSDETHVPPVDSPELQGYAQDDVTDHPILGLEADELVDHGDSEADVNNLDMHE